MTFGVAAGVTAGVNAGAIEPSIGSTVDRRNGAVETPSKFVGVNIG